MTIYTIGYGNRQPANFFALLPDAGKVIDVRRSPNAWCHDYSLLALRARFPKRYVWAYELGNMDGGTEENWCMHPMAMGWLDGLAEAINDGATITLLCAESDHRRCHRRHIATALQALVHGLQVEHL